MPDPDDLEGLATLLTGEGPHTTQRTDGEAAKHTQLALGVTDCKQTTTSVNLQSEKKTFFSDLER